MQSFSRAQSLYYAFTRSIPVMLGYLFLGIAYGIVLQRAGYGPLWALFSSVTIFAGSAQFVTVNLLQAAAGLLTVAVTIFLVNSRHIFYGLTFVEKFRGLRSRPYLIFALSDETYSLLCSMPELDQRSMDRTMFFIAIMDQSYWVIGSVIGGILGEALPFDLTGIDFSMTALFTVIVVDQLTNRGFRLPALIGGVSAAACLAVLGPSNFLLPSLVITVTMLFVLRGPISRLKAEKGAEA